MSDIAGLYLKLAPAGVESLDLPLLFQERNVAAGAPALVRQQGRLISMPKFVCLESFRSPSRVNALLPLLRYLRTVLEISPSRM